MVSEPTILAVGGDPAVLEAITRGLPRQFGAEGAEMLTALTELTRRHQRWR